MDMSKNGSLQLNDSVAMPVWLNKSIVEEALKECQNDRSVQVVAVDIEPATSKGENYASLMFRCKASYTTEKLNGVSFALS